MAATNPSYYESGACQDIKQKEHRFHLYMQQRVEASPDANQKVVVNPGLPNLFGVIAVNDWIIRDGPAANANLIGRARGMHIGGGKADQSWLLCHSILFTDSRFTTLFQELLALYFNCVLSLFYLQLVCELSTLIL
jgi:hypothetical protein